MKKVLGVMGSPRINGNTHILLEKLLEGAKSKGADTEMIILNGKKIIECDGGHACWKTGKCTKKDDMSDFYEIIAASDAIVFATPVYWYGPTALMKAFLDRFVFFNGVNTKKMIEGKSAVVLTALEQDDPKGARLLIEMFRLSLDWMGMKYAGELIAHGVYKKGDILKREDYLKKAYELGIALVDTRP
jgi:multimeric flavodoxin WrbA